MSDSTPPTDPPPTDPHYASATPGAAGAGTPRVDGLTRFFDGIRSLGIVRGDDRWFAGVLGGIAARTGLAPTALRIVVILFGVLGAPVLFAYVLAWALLPDLQGRIHAEQALRGVFEPVIIAIVVLLIASFPPFGGTALWRWPWRITGLPDWISTMLSIIWGIAITIGIVWLIVYLVRQASSRPVSAPGWGASPGPSAGAAGSSPDAGWPTDAWADTAAEPDGSLTDVLGLTTPEPDASTGVRAPDPVAEASRAEGAPQDDARAHDGQARGSEAAGPEALGAQARGSNARGGQVRTPADPQGTAAQQPPADQGQWSAAERHWATQWSAEQAAQQAAEQAAARQAAQRDAQQERARQAAERAAWYRDTRPGAAVTAIVLGLGLVVGALTVAIYSGGDFTNEAFVLGLAALLAVLALGVIVAGLLGRRSGGLGGFALLTILALIPAAVFPFGSQVSAFGTAYWEVANTDEPQSYAVLAGQPTIDLSNLEETGSDPVTVDVWLGIGQTEVILPDDMPVRIDANVLIGSIEYTGTTDGQDRGGLFLHDSRVVGASNSGSLDDQTAPLIRIWTLIGQISITDDSR